MHYSFPFTPRAHLAPGLGVLTGPPVDRHICNRLPIMTRPSGPETELKELSLTGWGVMTGTWQPSTGWKYDRFLDRITRR